MYNEFEENKNINVEENTEEINIPNQENYSKTEAYKEIIEEKNKGEALIYQAQKTIKDLGDKADAEKVKEINEAITRLQETLKGEDTEKMKADAEALTKPLYEMTSKMYEAAQQQGASEAGAAQQDSQQKKKSDDNVVDADYKVVDDDNK